MRKALYLCEAFLRLASVAHDSKQLSKRHARPCGDSGLESVPISLNMGDRSAAVQG